VDEVQREPLAVALGARQDPRRFWNEARVGVAVRDDDQKRRAAQPAAHELEEPKRPLVGDVQIIEHHDERRAPPALARSARAH
jgi:hypothetical protein